jgi:hypothetical protein
VELLEVRHSVFIIGSAGTGKSEVWKTLYRTYSNLKLKPYYNDIEPKAVTNDELFGVISPATREWVDGTVWRIFVVMNVCDHLFLSARIIFVSDKRTSSNARQWGKMDGDGWRY